MPENPYRVFASEDLVEPVWSNVTPDGVVFSDAQGSYDLPMGERKGFCFAVASDYLVVDLSEGPTATNYPVSYTNNVPDGGWGDEYMTTKLVLRRIPGGTFIMGSPTNELGRFYRFEKQRIVTLTKDYYIGVFEVTQKQWERVMGYWPSVFTNAVYRDSRPVEYVSYDIIRGTVAGTNWPANSTVDADSFMGRMRIKTEQAFDLPTDTQWERACRAETTTALNSGYNLTNTIADSRMDAVGRYRDNGWADFTGDSDTSVGTAKVGSYLPNAWGLYDMHGNVWECCLDWCEEYYVETTDPKGADIGAARVNHGGAWNRSADYCRSAYRHAVPPFNRDYFYGLRVAIQPLSE